MFNFMVVVIMSVAIVWWVSVCINASKKTYSDMIKKPIDTKKETNEIKTHIDTKI